jgi:hypothetical protein
MVLSRLHSRSGTDAPPLRAPHVFPALLATLVLGGCTTTVHRTIVRSEIVPAKEVEVSAVHLTTGDLVAFAPESGAFVHSPRGTHVAGTLSTGDARSVPLDSLAEIEITYTELSVPKSMIVLSSIVGAGALFVYSIAVPK